MMDCVNIREQLDAYQDGELDALRAAALEVHLTACSECARAHDAGLRLRDAIRASAPYHVAPQRLREYAGALSGERPRERRPITLRLWQLLTLLAASAAVSATSVLLVPNLALRQPDQRLASVLVDAHVRSLMQNHLLDVASTDQHTVKPWFAGKLDYSPPVHDLTGAGFPLIGGRVDYVNGHAVAALVYERRQHRINVFVWPAGRIASPVGPLAVNGYNAVAWNAEGMTFWAVSDLNVAELEALRAHLAGTARLE